MDRPLGLAARCPGVFGHHSARTQATESACILSPPKFESAQSAPTPAFASMPPHHHSHDRHPHPQQRRTGPGTPEHMRAVDCGQKARGDMDGNANGNGEGGKNDEENQLPRARCKSFFYVIFLPSSWPRGLAMHPRAYHVCTSRRRIGLGLLLFFLLALAVGAGFCVLSYALPLSTSSISLATAGSFRPWMVCASCH
jgi:hypothetical protein